MHPLLRKLLNFELPIPAFVVGCFPAIFTIGASPKGKLPQKLMRTLRCLACPFLGLFYTCNIKNDETALYWLPKSCFIGVDGSNIPYKPFGHHAMEMKYSDANRAVLEKLEDCMTNASVMERFSSLASAYYIILGLIVGISRVLVPSICEDWPYIPLALAWTLPAIYRRTVNARLLVDDPKVAIGDGKITMQKFVYDEDREHMHSCVVLTVLASIAVPWLSVILAYFTPPKGFFCRSKYLTVFCTIWTFNCIVAYIHHWVGENNKLVNRIIRIWFSACGVGIAMLLIVLGLLSIEREWWIRLFGETCGNTCHEKKFTF
ncbi:5001_t:CDS:1 [Ambispora gerdemannii]|uniref:5001_t:CDS:1 n=1 Tax=Ambispora gerdemannii TaxID=144530 RepID=A0A9N9B3V0_9GLOM|nr:5001_t:CDS:1 [Ambispora gerdemannii]